MDYLSDLEKEKLTSFMNDKVMLEAVKKVMLKGIYQNGVLKSGEKADPLKNFALGLAFRPGISNEILGEDVKACAQGISFLELGFKEIGNIVNSEPILSPIQSGVNPAE